MYYQESHILSENTGNNAFSYDIRTSKSLYIPALIEWSLDDVKIGTEIVFEEVEDGKLRSCLGLEHFIRLRDSSSSIFQLFNIPITIFDNHNHALYFWYEALSEWIITPWVELIHIDEHSDLWKNENDIGILTPDLVIARNEAIHVSETAGSLHASRWQKHETLLDIAWYFTNYQCNVGNYIAPAIANGLVWKVIRIENDHELDAYMDYTPSANSILNLDLDFFSPEMSFIDEEKKIRCIRNLLAKVQCVTIATSPYFIDQWLAIQKLHQIFQEI